jgi:cytidyltransferase-like protein
MKIIVATGGFDPIHSGHIAYLREAKKLGDTLIVGVNSDAWLERKKGRAFMPLYERQLIVSALDCVDAAYKFNDDDGSACEFLKFIKDEYPTDEIIFVNGGDRTADNIPEMSVEGVTFEFGVGGDNKANSSSWILQDWKEPKTLRPWGYYRVLYEVPGTKVKELVVNPGCSLSMQRHNFRSEYWKVTQGMARVYGQKGSYTTLGVHGAYLISRNEWHQLTNPFPDPCKIVEIQYGYDCAEDDIERQ